MSAPINYARNNYDKKPKKSTHLTPVKLAQFLHDVLHSGYPLGFPNAKFRVVADLAIGTGRLTDPWTDARIIGIDPMDHEPKCDRFYHAFFEDLTEIETPDLMICNPPFNGAGHKRRLYPEILLEHAIKLIGKNCPIAMFVPAGFRNNQRLISKRFRWVRDSGAEITSIITLPLNIFPLVEFPMELIVWNVGGIKPHYWLPDWVME